MRIRRLQADNLRRFEHLDFEPAAGVNWLLGPNGAGKTTLLEAAYLLSRGRSFRAGGRGAPTRHGASEYLIHAVVSGEACESTRVGLARSSQGWRARRDGKDLATLGPLFEACPVVYFGPETQALVLGAAEERRSYLDWSVFHVEHASLAVWRDWRRALRQRNALLRTAAPAGDFEPWEHDLARLAGQIDQMRVDCLAGLEPHLAREAASLVPELGTMRVVYRAGWDRDLGLARQLALQRDRDRERAFTWHGAHRADWFLSFEGVAHREHLSRGQAKAIALVCILAQACWMRDRVGTFPLLCLDDLGSELDSAHIAKVVGWLEDKPVQAWLTATRIADADIAVPGTTFHVEHGGLVRSGGA